MYQKSQCILLWTYSRNAELMDKEFLTKVINAMLTFQGQVFHLDNFDLLLILQSAMHLERSPEVQDDPVFFTKICQLTQMADTFAVQNLEKMSLHEYTTTVIYYFNHQDVMSTKLRQALIEKMGKNIQEFNEYQLHVFKKLLSDLKEAEDNSQIQEVIANLDLELEAIRREKVLMASEARLREEI